MAQKSNPHEVMLKTKKEQRVFHKWLNRSGLTYEDTIPRASRRGWNASKAYYKIGGTKPTPNTGETKTVKIGALESQVKYWQTRHALLLRYAVIEQCPLLLAELREEP